MTNQTVAQPTAIYPMRSSKLEGVLTKLEQRHEGAKLTHTAAHGVTAIESSRKWVQRLALEIHACAVMNKYVPLHQQARIVRLESVRTEDARSGAIGVILVAFNGQGSIEATVYHGEPSTRITPSDQYHFVELLEQAASTRQIEVL